MRAVGVVEAVLVQLRVEVRASGGEGRRAGADGVDVEPVEARRKAVDVHVHVDDAASVLDQARPADRRAAGVDEAGRCLARAIRRCERSPHGEQQPGGGREGEQEP